MGLQAPEIIVIALTVVIFTFGFAVGFFVGQVFGQTAEAQTPSIQTPSPNLEFLPQKAYVQTQPPAGVQPVNNNASLQDMLIPIVVSVVGIVLAKISGDKKDNKIADVVKEVVAETVKGKEVDKELARVTYAMNPEAAAKIDNAPSVKIQTLTEDATEYAVKAAKTKLPT